MKQMCPYAKTELGLPILDTEEKLQWYMDKLLMRKVDLYYVSARISGIEEVTLIPRRSLLQQHIMNYDTPTVVEPSEYGTISNEVVPVLREVHARREAEEKKAKADEFERLLRAKREAELIKEKKKAEADALKAAEKNARSFWQIILGRKENA